MKIGLIDVDGHNFPNLALMKISAYHKQRGDAVEWYEPMFSGHMDKVYLSKVFSFSPDYEYPIDADVIERGGSGYCISIDENGREYFDQSKAKNLPDEIEHIYPDYSIYPELTKDKAFGFMTRGCPRGCSFCHVAAKEGKCSVKVADLSEFWRGQKNIILSDPNVLACKEWRDILQQLADSGSNVEFNQGLDVRLLTEEKAQALAKIKLIKPHFAYDRIEDREIVEKQLRYFVGLGMMHPRKIQVFVLCGDRERRVTEDDLHRIYFLRELGVSPYVMLYEKEQLPRGHELRRLQRWVNNRFIFWTCATFDEYQKEPK